MELNEPRPVRVLAAMVAVVLLAGIGVVVVVVRDGDRVAEADGPGAMREPAEEVAFDCAAWNALGDEGAAAADGDDTPLPGDDGLRAGTLDNELDYYVRTNDRPGGSAALALAVDAGAALEDDDQSGAAHFLEHMLFNGTEGFPGNELGDVLVDLGVEFGADLNASTSEDATVYFLELGNDEASIDQGLDVLLEWATRATIAPEDVEEERAVILEERRQRLGPEARFFDRVRDLSLVGTPYEGHEVIGTVESLETMTAEKLRRYYEDWYRPDLMSVVAAGDFDAATIEAEIRDRFSAIPASGPDARPRPQLESGLADEPRFGSYIDDELLGTSAELVFTRPATPVETAGDLRRELLRDVGLTVVDRRLNDAAARGTVPFYEVDVEVFDQVREFETMLLSVDAEPEQLGDALEAVTHELARIRRHGLGEAEVARAIADRRARATADREGAPSTQDRQVMSRLVSHALEDAPMTPAGPYAEAELSLLDQIAPAEVAAELRAITDCTDLAAQAGVPTAYEDVLPDEDRIVVALESATSADGADGADGNQADAEVPDSIMDRPEPATPVQRRDTELVYGPARFLEYRNGVRVVINPSDISAGFVTVHGESPGGLAAIGVDHLANARPAARLVNDSGVGDLDRVDLDRALSGKNVTSSATIGIDRERISAWGSTPDLETVLQLLHQRVVAPRIDDGAVDTLRGESRLTAEDPTRRGDTAMTDAIDELLRRDDPRYREQTTAADLEALDPVRALQLYRARFGDVSDFVFTIVGDVDLDAAEDVANRYLGTLPGGGREEDGAHDPPSPPGEVTQRTVNAGQTPQARIRVVYDVAVPVEPVVRDRGEALVAVLDAALRDRIREELGASYSPSISLAADETTGRIRTFVSVDGSPDRMDEISAEIQRVVADLRDTGPTEDEVQRALQPVLRDLQFSDLGTISDSWMYVLTHPDRPVADVPAAATLRLEDLDAAAVQDLARRLLPADVYVEVIQLPEV